MPAEQYVIIKRDDNHASGVKRFVKGDRCLVIDFRKRASKSGPPFYKVKLPYRSYIGERGLSTIHIFGPSEVMEE